MLPPDKKIKPVHDAAIAFARADATQKRAAAKRNDARATLVAAMERRDITVYRHPDVQVELTDTIKPKVHVGPLAEEDDDNEKEE